MRAFAALPTVLALFSLTACSDEVQDDVVDTMDTAMDTAETGDTGDTGEPVVDDMSYAFEGREGGSSVSYTGQVFRHLLISDMYSHMAGLTDRLNSGSLFPEEGDVAAELGFYLDFDSDTSGELPFGFSSDPAPAQIAYNDISSGKDIVGKLAGNDPVGQHKDWSTEFVGWSAEGVTSPESLVRHWVGQLDAAAVDWAFGTIATDPSGNPVPNVYVTAEGTDLRQLIQKFLVAGVAYSQAADDYLDDDTEGKGLLADHTMVEEGKAYTALEHAWDEGFGYFGATVTYGEWTDAEISAGTKDVDGNLAIDLTSEVVWGHAGNAGKRDNGANVPTDFSGDAFKAFRAGRAILAEADGELSADEMDALEGHRDAALLAWESAIAATVVHYINDTLKDMGEFGTEAYSFGDHAKHWSEMKGFALAFQFSRFSSFSDAEFAELHDLLGQAPVLSDAGETAIADYKADLLAARTLVGEAMGFDADNLGDDDGQNGW